MREGQSTRAPWCGAREPKEEACGEGVGEEESVNVNSEEAPTDQNAQSEHDEGHV